MKLTQIISMPSLTIVVILSAGLLPQSSYAADCCLLAGPKCITANFNTCLNHKLYRAYYGNKFCNAKKTQCVTRNPNPSPTFNLLPNRDLPLQPHLKLQAPQSD